MVKVGIGADLAGGMGGDSEQHVFRVDTFAVIHDANQVHTAVDNFEIDASGKCIDAVFQEFLDDAGGSFDDFAGGNPVDDLSIKLLDAGHSGGCHIRGKLQTSSLLTQYTKTDTVCRRCVPLWGDFFGVYCSDALRIRFRISGIS